MFICLFVCVREYYSTRSSVSSVSFLHVYIYLCRPQPSSPNYLHKDSLDVFCYESGIVESVIGEIIGSFVVEVRIVGTPFDEFGLDLRLDVLPGGQASGLEKAALISSGHGGGGGGRRGGEGCSVPFPL